MANKDELRLKRGQYLVLLKAAIDSLAIWEGYDTTLLSMGMGSLFPMSFYPIGSTWNLMYVSAGAKPEVMEHGEQGFLEVVE